MSVSFKIEVSNEPTDLLINRFRNFGEDIWRELKDISAVNLDEIDRSTTSFYVRKIRRRDVIKALPLIKRLLVRHNFAETATITRFNGDEPQS